MGHPCGGSRGHPPGRSPLTGAGEKLQIHAVACPIPSRLVTRPSSSPLRPGRSRHLSHTACHPVRTATTNPGHPHRNEPATPPLSTVLTSWHVDGAGLAALAIAASLYLGGMSALRRRGERWPVRPALWFFVLGLGSYAVVTFGFLGDWSTDLRWAFTTRMALLLFAVPALISLGQPVALARRVLAGQPLRVMNAVLGSWPVRALGSVIVAPLVAFAAFCVFLTPVAGLLRTSVVGSSILTVVVPLVGLVMVLPIIDRSTHRTSFFITVEFMLVFVELVIDAIPAILLRLHSTVIDGTIRATGTLPGWFPNPLRDQQLAGDWLWFIAEAADIPVLIVLFVRWSRIDRSEAKELDEISDEEMARRTREHLRAPRQD